MMKRESALSNSRVMINFNQNLHIKPLKQPKLQKILIALKDSLMKIIRDLNLLISDLYATKRLKCLVKSMRKQMNLKVDQMTSSQIQMMALILMIERSAIKPINSRKIDKQIHHLNQLLMKRIFLNSKNYQLNLMM